MPHGERKHERTDYILLIHVLEEEHILNSNDRTNIFASKDKNIYKTPFNVTYFLRCIQQRH